MRDHIRTARLLTISDTEINQEIISLLSERPTWRTRVGRDPPYYLSPGGGPPGGGPPPPPSPGGPRGGPTTQPSGVFPSPEPPPPPQQPPPPPPSSSNQSGSETVTANTAPMSQPAMQQQPAPTFQMNSDTDYDTATDGYSTDQEVGRPSKILDRFTDQFDATPSRSSSSAPDGVGRRGYEDGVAEDQAGGG